MPSRIIHDDWWQPNYTVFTSNGYISKSTLDQLLPEIEHVLSWLVRERGDVLSPFTRSDLHHIKEVVDIYHNHVKSLTGLGIVQIRAKASENSYRETEYRFSELFLADRLLLKLSRGEIGGLSYELVLEKATNLEYPQAVLDAFFERHMADAITEKIVLNKKSLDFYRNQVTSSQLLNWQI